MTHHTVKLVQDSLQLTLDFTNSGFPLARKNSQYSKDLEAGGPKLIRSDSFAQCLALFD